MQKSEHGIFLMLVYLEVESAGEWDHPTPADPRSGQTNLHFIIFRLAVKNHHLGSSRSLPRWPSVQKAFQIHGFERCWKKRKCQKVISFWIDVFHGGLGFICLFFELCTAVVKPCSFHSPRSKILQFLIYFFVISHAVRKNT